MTVSSSTVDVMVTVPQQKLSDISILNNRIYVSSFNSGTDSLFVFDSQLQQVKGIKTGAPGLSLDVCQNGKYESVIAYTAATSANDNQLLFINLLLNTEPAGQMNIGTGVRAVSFSPGGNAMVVTTADKIFKVGL